VAGERRAFRDPSRKIPKLKASKRRRRRPAKIVAGTKRIRNGEATRRLPTSLAGNAGSYFAKASSDLVNRKRMAGSAERRCDE
jgi:hypothetical protein